MCYVMFCIKQDCKAVLIIANDRNLSFRKLSQFPASHSPEETEPGSELGTDHKHKPMLYQMQNGHEKQESRTYPEICDENNQFCSLTFYKRKAYLLTIG